MHQARFASARSFPHRFVVLTAIVMTTVTLAVPAGAAADPSVPVAEPVGAVAPSATLTTIELRGSEATDSMLSFVIVRQPEHGHVVLDDVAPACTWPDGHSTCTATATYASDGTFLGTDTFQYVLRNQLQAESEPATVSVTVTGTRPVLEAPATVTVGQPWSLLVRDAVGATTVDFGDGTAVQTPTPGSTQGTATASHAFTVVGTYAVAVTNRASNGTVTTRSSVTVTPIPPPPAPTNPVSAVILPPALPTLPPTSPGQSASSPVLPGAVGGAHAPGLFVNVTAGAILLNTGAGNLSSFQAGQFGFTPSFRLPPSMLPVNPGIPFSPPPSFVTTLGTGYVVITGAGTAPSATIGQSYGTSIDCVVRSRPHAVDAPKKTFCNGRGAASGWRSARSTAQSVGARTQAVDRAVTDGADLIPELWYIAPDGTPRPVVGSTAPGAVNGIDPATRSVVATFDATSTPPLASLEQVTYFATVLRPRTIAPYSPVRRTSAPRVTGWPTTDARLASGRTFTCPTTSKRACTVELRAVSSQYGVRRTVGARQLTVRAGATVPLDVALTRYGRWRFANQGIVATLAVHAVAYQPGVRHLRTKFGVRVHAPRIR